MERLKHLLKETPWFRALLYSKPHRAYQDWSRPQRRVERKAEVDFYRRCFSEVCSENRLVFDVGANTGDKVEAFRALDLNICAFEPDPGGFAALQTRYRRDTHVTLVNAAVSTQAGQAMFHQYRPQSAYNTLSTQWKEELENSGALSNDPEKNLFSSSLLVDTVDLDEAITRYGTPFFIKIDVEGHELEVLQGLHSQGWELLSFEANLPTFLKPTLEAIRLIQTRFPQAQFHLTGGHLQFNPENWLSAEQASEFLSTQTPAYTEIFVRRAMVAN